MCQIAWLVFILVLSIIVVKLVLEIHMIVTIASHVISWVWVSITVMIHEVVMPHLVVQLFVCLSGSFPLRPFIPDWVSVDSCIPVILVFKFIPIWFVPRSIGQVEG